MEIGPDTIALLKKGYNVISIDKENIAEKIVSKLTFDELKRFTFLQSSFENIEIPKSDLIVSNFALSFCNKNSFDEFWDKINNSININGFLVGNVFGINDEWNNGNSKMTFLNKNQLLEKLNKFEIINFSEKEYDGKTAIGKEKHWHIFFFIVKKK